MEKMKQLNRCPNCGGTLGSIKDGFMRCEYCDSEFLSPYPPHIVVATPTDEDMARLKKEVSKPNVLKIRPFGVNDIPRFEDGTPVTSETIKKNMIALDAGHVMKARF